MKNVARLKMNEDLLLTVGVLVAALVYITKTALDYVVKRKNGKPIAGEDRIGKILKRVEVLSTLAKEIKDLHDWHAPQIDAETGQPKFVWYANVQDLRDDIEALDDRLDEIIKALPDE